MTDIKKALWNRSGTNVELSFDMQKVVNESDRIVIGFATLDNIDLSNEIVTQEATMKAFERFRGNVRVQHDQSLLAGTVKKFTPAEFYDEATQKTYKGIQVAVEISKGAENVWQMCLDGTLSGFSIGGAVIKSSTQYQADQKKTVKVIEDYVLTELSLVDSPANHLANIHRVSTPVHKALGSSSDLLEKNYTEYSLFWCGIDRVATKSQDQEHTCFECGESMAKLGGIAVNEDVQTQLTKVLSELNIDMEGGQSQVTDTTLTIEKGADGEEIAAAVNEVPVEQKPEEEVKTVEEAKEEIADEKPADDSNAETAAAEAAGAEKEPDFNAELKNLIEQLAAKLEESSASVSKNYTDVKDEVATISKQIGERFDQLEERQKAFDEQAASLKDKIETTEKALTEAGERLDKISDSAAIKKSHRVESVSTQEPENKSKFDGLFSKAY